MEKSSNQITMKWEQCPNKTSHGLCALIRQQSLVDVVISCGAMTMQAHKCVLAAHSNYLKNELQTKPVDQIVFNGVDFPVVLSLVEFIYFGQTKINKSYLKHFLALVKLFEIPSLDRIFLHEELRPYLDDNITIPLPQFTYDPSKYPALNHNITYNNEVANFVELPSTSTVDCNEILTVDKMKSLLNNKHVEIFFETSDGINIRIRHVDDLMNLIQRGLQYYIIDNITGRIGQVHKLQLTNNHQENQTNENSEENMDPDSTTGNLDQNSMVVDSNTQSELSDDSNMDCNDSEISSTESDLTNSETE